MTLKGRAKEALAALSPSPHLLLGDLLWLNQSLVGCQSAKAPPVVSHGAPGRGLRGEPKTPAQRIRQHFYLESGARSCWRGRGSPVADLDTKE